MKKILTLIACLFCLSAFSQDDQKFHLGLKAAPSLAWLRSDSPGFTSDGSKFGFTYGLITEFNFAKNYAFATGIDVTYRGGKFKSQTETTDTITIYSASRSLQYVEIPVTLKFKTNEIGYLKYFLQAGVSPGVNIRARENSTTVKQSVATANITTSTREKVDVQKSTNNFNLSMIIGGGVEYTLSGSTVILVGIQFSNGFIDTFDDSNKVNSNYLALNLGILF